MSDFDAGYQRAVDDVRWLAAKRDEYGGPRKVENVADYFALHEAERRLYDEVKTASHIASMLDGRNDASGWLPSWRWDEWESRKQSHTDD